MKISRLERLTLLLTALVLAFLSGWFLCRRQEAARVFVPSEIASPVPVSPSAPAPEAGGERVNINTADAQTLQTLPGIGEKRALDIIAYRESNGPFIIPEAITDVPGIGPSTLEEILELITVEEAA